MNAEAVQLALPLTQEVPRAHEGLRSIERDFPIVQVSRLAQIESYRKNIYRAAYYLHKWWARRTGATFRAILLGTLLPEGHSPLDFFYQAHSFEDTIILDPFMGGGTTVGEALRLGTRVIGVDINPVSWFLVKKIVEPVSPRALNEVYRHLKETVGQEILHLYETACPTCGGLAQAVYTHWVKIIPCRACDELVSLRKSNILARHMSKRHTGLVVCPACGHVYLSTTLNQPSHCPACGEVFEAHQGLARGAYYTCPACRSRQKILDSVREMDGPPQHKMVAIHTHCRTCGKGYKKPDTNDLSRYESIKARFEENQERWLYPRVSIPYGYNTKQMINYNYRFWHQMFNARQLIGLSTLLEAILSIQDPNVKEFMLLLFSGTCEFNNMFCSAKGLGTGAVRHLFAHHAFIPAKEPLEANLWGVNRSSGGFSTLYRGRLRRGKVYARQPVERRLSGNKVVKVPIHEERLETSLATSFEELVSTDRRALLLNQSSSNLSEIPDRSVDAVVTDPPYLDNVMYAELADFFYVWLRLELKDCYPQWEQPSTVQPEEAIKNVEQGKDEAFYQGILTAVFQECQRVLKDQGLLVFTFHHGAAEAWDALAGALKEAGFVIVQVWPVHAEMDVGVPVQGKRGICFDTILVCRKTGLSVEPLTVDSTNLAQWIRNETEARVKRLEPEFTLTREDRISLSRGMAAMLFTHERTDLPPSMLVQEV
jgi:putative DNA methylase